MNPDIALSALFFAISFLWFFPPERSVSLGFRRPHLSRHRQRRNKKHQSINSKQFVPILLNLMAAALLTGLPISVALEEALKSCRREIPEHLLHAIRMMNSGVSPSVACAHLTEPWLPLASALMITERTGAAIAPLLKAAAHDSQRAFHRETLIAIQGLTVRLVLPLGLTILPAFIFLAIIPIVAGFAVPVLTKW
ncbi:MAG: type II secretion system F family protein [Actinomycetota bacterium]